MVERVGEDRMRAWGAGLGYPAWIHPLLPPLHAGFNRLNRYLGVPALRAGLGGLMSSPWSGYLMILRTHGRSTGRLREAPLGYIIRGDAVYCLAGFGTRTHWYRNVLADPHVEVITARRAFSGIAEEVTDPEERREVLAPLLRSMGLVVAAVGLGNPWRASPDQLVAACAGMPLVRIRATGIAAGPDDPGGLSWVLPLAGTLAVGAALLSRRRPRRAARDPGAPR